jgi:hypothetical protein
MAKYCVFIVKKNHGAVQLCKIFCVGSWQNTVYLLLRKIMVQYSYVRYFAEPQLQVMAM